MNGLKTIPKKLDRKIQKTLNIKVKMPHLNTKPLARKRILVQTPLSHSTLKSEQKTFPPQNHFFPSTSCFGRDENHRSNWLQIMKICELTVEKTQPEEFRKQPEASKLLEKPYLQLIPQPFVFNHQLLNSPGWK